MPFNYAIQPHVRKHGPIGYNDFTSYKPWLRDEFHFRCVYCLGRERWYPSGHAAFGVEHALPKSNPAHAARICNYEILLYACSRCNSEKRNQQVLDPCQTSLGEHLRVSVDGSIIGLTSEGWQLVNILRLNKSWPRKIRQRAMRIRFLYQTHPNDPEIEALYRDHFGYPDDLPNLDILRPESNSRPEGLTDAYFRQRAEGRLPAEYF